MAIWGGYGTYELLNWAAKFHSDAARPHHREALRDLRLSPDHHSCGLTLRIPEAGPHVEVSGGQWTE